MRQSGVRWQRASEPALFLPCVRIFLAGELIFQVHAGRARLDHSFDQFKDIERPAKTSFGVGHDRHEPIDIVFALDTRDLVGALQSLIDPFYHSRHAVCRIKTLIGIHLAGEICIGRHLPSAKINRFESRPDLLKRLVPGERAESVDEGFGLKQTPKLFRAAPRQCVFDDDVALQSPNIAERVTTRNPFPAGIIGPIMIGFFILLFFSTPELPFPFALLVPLIFFWDCRLAGRWPSACCRPRRVLVEFLIAG